MNEIGKRLRAAQTRLGWTWNRIAVEIGVGSSTVYRLARGEARRLHEGTRRMIESWLAKV